MPLLKHVVALVLLLLITGSEASAPLFLHAITSALATIPFTGGPMTSGLLGAKLGIGAKLLYYLGYFGRSSKSKPAASSASKPKSSLRKNPQIPAGLQALPLPYVMSTGAPQMGGFGFGGGSGGGFQSNFQQKPFDSAQMFQALTAQGFDANTAMQVMNYGGGGFGMSPGMGFGLNNAPGMGFGLNNAPGMGFGLNNAPGMGFAMNNAPVMGFGANNADGLGLGANNPPGMGFSPNDVLGAGFQSNMDGSGSHHSTLPSTFQSTSENIVEGSVTNAESTEGSEDSDDVESFFTFLRDMDENTCISRLMCDIGTNPAFLGEFSENIHGIVSSLDVQPSSGAYPYIQIMEQGRTEGSCDIKFPQCTDTAYEIVKNVAPSVGIPQNVNSEAVNRL